jgi:hypothetical protein
MNEYQFFKKVEIELDELIKRIERNENNEKDLFWENKKHKNEEKCRDALVNLWKSNDNFIRESLIENFRTDIEVVEKKRNWKVRIECKLDKNPKLLKSLNEQLINKYLNNREAKYGIYLVFYFGNKNESKEELEKKLKQQIPPKWKDKVSVKLLNLKK